MTAFENDILKRKRFAENLTTILKNSDKHLINDNNSLVIALDSPWGTGKTKFLKEWTKLLEDDKFEILNYNAWESDYSEDALMPIINQIYKQESFTAKKEDLKNNTLQMLKYVSKGIAKNLILGKLGEEALDVLRLIEKDVLEKKEVREVVENEKIKKDILEKKFTNKYYDDFLQFNKVKDEFIKFLEGLSSNKTVVFFIDELDRCKPTFSIRTLEIIKHFFNVKNFIFVIALDMEQLSQSVKTIYGQDMDTCGYLRRFFDLHFKIPKPKIEDYVKFVLENKKLNCSEKNNKFIVNISKIFENLNLSLREINSILENYKLLLHTSLNSVIELSDYAVLEVFLYLITLKYKEPHYYEVILYKRFIQNGKSTSSMENPTKVPGYILQSTENISAFVKLLECGNNHKIIDGFSNESLEKLTKYLGGEIAHNTNITIGQYIEEKIEIFNYTN